MSDFVIPAFKLYVSSMHLGFANHGGMDRLEIDARIVEVVVPSVVQSHAGMLDVYWALVPLHCYDTAQGRSRTVAVSPNPPRPYYCEPGWPGLPAPGLPEPPQRLSLPPGGER